MSDIPRYPTGGSDAPRDITPDPAQDAPQPARSRRALYLAWALGIAIVVLFIVLHLAGVLGPGDH